MIQDNIDILISRPDNFEACRDCKVVNSIASKMRSEALLEIEKNPEYAGAVVEINCKPHDTEHKQVRPVTDIKYKTMGVRTTHTPHDVATCPGL